MQFLDCGTWNDGILCVDGSVSVQFRTKIENGVISTRLYLRSLLILRLKLVSTSST